MQSFKTVFLILTTTITTFSLMLIPNSNNYHLFSMPIVGVALGEQVVTEQAKTNFIQLVDTPYNITYPGTGMGFVRLLPNQTTVPVSGYRQVCVEVAPKTLPSVTTSFDLFMGKISGQTLATRIGQNVTLGPTIYCYSIEGPEIGLLLHGKPGATDQVELWVYLTS